ncbi:protein C1orf43 homolog isoform X1 [Centruroides vittatus]|uniref:protein C1orf43 homolog isoform X1 n=1 Tax=Centruroides vittatus TaxID=120091 RepID=UPI0035109E11
MEDELSGFAVIICIAFGVMTFILLFIFAKRQITRFTLKSRYGPHVPIGYDAPKVLRQEIDRQLEIVKHIQCKPKLYNDDFKYIENNKYPFFPVITTNRKIQTSLVVISKLCTSDESCGYFGIISDPCKRLPNQDIRHHLLFLSQSGLLIGCDTQLIHKFVDIYEHARHEPEEFNFEHYILFIELMEQIYKCLNENCPSQKLDGNKLKVLTEHLKNFMDVDEKMNEKQPPILLKRPMSLNMNKEESMNETTV